MKRWTVHITYEGYDPYDVEVEELDELQDIMEKEKNWNQLQDVTITYNRKT